MPAWLQQEESGTSISIKSGAATGRKSSWGFLTSRQPCRAGLGRGCVSPPWSRQHGTGGDVEAATAQHGVQLEGHLRLRSGCLALLCRASGPSMVGRDTPASAVGTFPAKRVGMTACGVGFHLCLLSFLAVMNSPLGAC